MDVVVVSAIKTIAAILEMLADWKTDLLARTYLKIWLFSTNTAIGPTTNLGALTPANYAGYAPITVASLNGPATDAANNGYLTTPEAFFTCSGGGVTNSIFSAGLVANIPGSTAATGTVVTTLGVISAPTVTGGGSGYISAPNVTVLGGGTGAVVTATVAGGVVTALTLVSGGTGYTAATLVIDPPLELVAGALFQAPRPMAVATDALPVVVQLTQPAGS
jgi:hypothetical protein